MDLAFGMADEARVGAEYYRRRAEDMRQRASATQVEEVRRSFLMLASHWDYLADMAEKSDKPN